MRTGWKNRPGVEYDEDDLETVYAEDMEAIREALNDLDLSDYAKLDGTNQPFTGNLNVSKADPEFRLINSDANYSYFKRELSTESSGIASIVSRQMTKGTEGSLFFPGNANGVSYGNTWGLASQFANATWAVWVKRSTSGTVFLIGKSNYSPSTAGGYYISLWSSNAVKFYSATSSYSTEFEQRNLFPAGFNIADNNWHLIVVKQYGYASIRMWVDNTEMTTVDYYRLAGSGGSWGSSVNFTVGSSANGNLDYSGNMDEVYMWDRALADAEISDLWNSGKGVYYAAGKTFPSTSTLMSTNLLLNSHFDEKSGTTAVNSTGLGNGTLQTGFTVPYCWETGKVFSGDVGLSDVSFIKTEDSVLTGTTSTLTVGDNSGYSLINGSTTAFQQGGVNKMLLNSSGFHLLDAVNINLGIVTGTKIGTATTQKIGFFNATPVAQQTATTDLGTVLSNLGLRAAGTAYPITTSGAVTFTNAAIKFRTDSATTYWGAGDDATIKYDGTNMLINPKAVGTGILDVLGTLQTDGYNSADGTAGMSDTRSFNDADGNAHAVTIKNGLITGWVVTPP